MKLISRRRWYFEQQIGICSLVITDACRARGGAMDFERPGKKPHAAYATWDHTFPRDQRCDGEGHYQLLACYKCNNKRNNTPPTAVMIARAMELHERWRQMEAAQQGALALSKARKRDAAEEAAKAKRLRRHQARMEEMQRIVDRRA